MISFSFLDLRRVDHLHFCSWMSFFPPCRRSLSLVNFSNPSSPPFFASSSSSSLPSPTPPSRVLITSYRQTTTRRISSLVTPVPSRDIYKPTRLAPIASASTMDLNGDLTSKRKRSSVAPVADRPSKHLKPENSTLTPGDSTPANGTVYDVENDDDANRTLLLGSAQADSPEWQATIETVVKSVVSIHFCQTCSFDTDMSMSSQATGFVVDAERGYILTNRHVVCAGPFWGYCIFDNHEEVRSRANWTESVMYGADV